MNSRFIPLNMPAKAAHDSAVGNPVTSRPESVVANCFPGLEIDHRNLDRRFFPGLIFEFVWDSDDFTPRGARLVKVDGDDPDAPTDADSEKVFQQLTTLIQNKQVFVDSLTQSSPGTNEGTATPQGGSESKRIELWETTSDHRTNFLDGRVAWRLVRSLEPGPVTIEFATFDGTIRTPLNLSLTANRREFQTADGTLSAVYKPGELGQSLCSPWQHDFRDCACTYWASNHPDIVLPVHPAGLEELIASGADPAAPETRILWLREDQNKVVAARLASNKNRPLEMDHYEINARWPALGIVLEGREIDIPYSPGVVQLAAPLRPEELPAELQRLGAMEHALALEYLFARYSVRFKDNTHAEEYNKLTEEQRDHANFIAHELLAVATSEMMHLRWVNQLLWQLAHLTKAAAPRTQLTAQAPFGPALGISEKVPGPRPQLGNPQQPAPAQPAAQKPQDMFLRKADMRPLDEAIADFIAAEQPSGSIDGAYARVFATLRKGYPPDMSELVSRIIADGVSHFVRFREIRAILVHHGDAKLEGRDYLPSAEPVLVRKLDRKLEEGHVYDGIKATYTDILRVLFKVYGSGDAEELTSIAEARSRMSELDAKARDLAKDGIGVPFLDIGKKALSAAQAVP